MYSNRMYIKLTKSKSLASSIVVSSIFVIHVMNGGQFLNATRAYIFPGIRILRLTRT